MVLDVRAPSTNSDEPSVHVDWRLKAKHRAIKSPFEPWFASLLARRDRRKGRAQPELAELLAERAALRACLVRELTVSSNTIDVGAHIGSVLRVIRRSAPNGRHVAIEADPAKAAMLARSFPDVEVVAAAVGPRAGRSRFEIDLQRGGYSRLVANEEAGDHDRRIIAVPVTTLDLVAADRRIELVKLDIEGGELGALRGAETLLDQRPIVIFECGMSEHLDWRSDMGELHDLFSRRDYEIRTVVDHLRARPALNLDEFLQTHEWPYRAWNFIARPTVSRHRWFGPPR